MARNDTETDGGDSFLTIEYVGTRTVERQYGDETVETGVYRYAWADAETDDGVHVPGDEVRINAVRIGCPECKKNATAIITPDGDRYRCICGYENDLTRGTLKHQQSRVEETWEPH